MIRYLVSVALIDGGRASGVLDVPGSSDLAQAIADKLKTISGAKAPSMVTIERIGKASPSKKSKDPVEVPPEEIIDGIL